MNPRRGGLRLAIVRHAETGQNRDGIVQGRADNPLSDLGLKQAEAVGDYLGGRELSAVYTSPLTRARQTAEAIGARRGLTATVVPDLVEMDIGEMEGLTGPEFRQRFPDFLRAWMSEGAGTVPMPGGESLVEVQTRAWAAIEHIGSRSDGGTVAVVSHNFVVLSVLCRVLGLPLHHFRRMRHHVAGVSLVEWGGGQTRLLSFNDVCHLDRAGLLGDDPWQRPR
jgi:broad specificity phosphatase PhoE